MAITWAVSALGVAAQGGVSAQGVVCLGVSAWGGCLPGRGLPDVPPVDRMTDTCKNIMLQMVMIGSYFTETSNKVELRIKRVRINRALPVS